MSVKFRFFTEQKVKVGVMRVVAALCHVRVRSMSWLAGHVIYPVFGWIWRQLNLLWRYCFLLLRKRFPRFIPRSLLPWRGDVGNDENEQQVRSCPEDLEGSPGHTLRESSADGWSSSRDEDRDEDRDEFDGDEYRVEPTDELYCDYDSTWETEQSHEPVTSRRSGRSAGRRCVSVPQGTVRGPHLLSPPVTHVLGLD